MFYVFYSQYSYLENFKCSSRATLRCLAGRMWPAGRTLPRTALNDKTVAVKFKYVFESSSVWDSLRMEHFKFAYINFWGITVLLGNACWLLAPPPPQRPKLKEDDSFDKRKDIDVCCHYDSLNNVFDALPSSLPRKNFLS